MAQHKNESSSAYFERTRPSFVDWQPPTEEEKALEVKGYLIPAHLFWSHVTGRAGDHRSIGVRALFGAGVLQHGETEIEDLHPSIRRQEDVLGLQVAMHDATRVCSAETVCNLERDIERRIDRQRTPM